MRRNLQIEAAAHVRLQAEIDRLAADGKLGEPAAPDFLCQLHREFYKGATEDMLRIRGAGRGFMMVPGEWRSQAEHDVAVDRHEPPSSARVPDFTTYFAERYRLAPLGSAGRLMAMAAAHHRFPPGDGLEADAVALRQHHQATLTMPVARQAASAVTAQSWRARPMMRTPFRGR